MKRLAKLTRLSVCALLALGASIAARAAGPLDNRVPQDAILYLGWAGADAQIAQYANSNLKGVIEASAVRDFVAQQLPKLMDQATRGDPEAVKKAQMLQSGLSLVWHHPTAFYFCPVDFTNPNAPALRAGVICDAGVDAKKTADMLNQILATNPPPPGGPIQVHVVQDGNIVMFTLGPDTADDLKKGGGLAAVPAYMAAMAKVTQANAAVVSYLDATKGLAMVNDLLAKIPNTPPQAREMIPAGIDALGLNSLTQAASTAGFDGKGWSQQAFIGINGPRKGIVALFGAEPLSDAALAVVPKDANAFSAWRLDLSRVFTETRTVIGRIDQPTQAQFDGLVAAGSKELGVDIEKDVLAPLGNEWVFYRGPIVEEGGNSMALVVKLKDADTFAKSLATLEKFYNAQAAASMFKVEKVTTSKMEVSTVAVTSYSIAWVVRNGYLYLSSLDGIAGAVKQVESKSPSIVESDLYKAARAALPAGAKPQSISYANPAKLYPELRRLLLGFLPLIRQAGFDIPKELLPDPSDVAPFMPPGATIAWSEADGVHFAAKSAFPGAELLGGQNMGTTSVAAVAVGAAVALPALARARTTATVNTVNVDMSNLRGITQSTMVYAADHGDQMPDDLARLVADGMLAPRQLVSRRAGTTPLEMTPELQKMAKSDYAKFSELIAQHNDFVYLGKGTKMDPDAAVIITYEKPGPQTRDGLNVAYRDGHVSFMRWPAAQQAFSHTNDYLKKNGMKPVDVKDLMTKAGVPDPGRP